MGKTDDSRMYRGEVVGLLRGFAQGGMNLDIDVVVPHREGALPGFGEFLLVEAGAARSMVGRVCQYRAAGRLMSEQGDSYLADLSRSDERPPAPIVQQMLRYTVKLQLLGQLHDDGERFRFTVGDRELATFGSPVREPSDAALAYLCNVKLDEDPSAAVLGELVYGQRVLSNVPVRFSVDRLKSRRSFVFARAGYGKSNLIKYLISQLYSAPPDVGLLIFDVEGEYALPDSSGRPGLVNIPGLADRISLYTHRRVPEEFGHLKKGDVHLDFGDFLPQDILASLWPDAKQELVSANIVRNMEIAAWRELIAYLFEAGFQADERQMAEILKYKLTARKLEGDAVLNAIKNNLAPPIRRLHRTDSPIGRNVNEELRQGRIVIVDTSLLGSEDALAISGLLLRRLFDHNRRHFTDPAKSVIRCLAVIEEAQAVLGSRDMDDRNIFVRWVKEGRKYELGVIMVTQQPGAIADQIISQGDNFFVLHLLNDADLNTLKRHNAYFADDILGVIRSEPIPGNCYFWSAPDQPFVLPVRVREFGAEHRVKRSPETTRRPAGPVAIATPMTPPDVERLVLAALGGNSKVWLYPVTADGTDRPGRPTELAFAADYLANAVALGVREAGTTAMPEDWFQRELPAMTDRILAAHGGRPGYAVLASVLRRVWALPATSIKLTSNKRVRSECVEIRAGI